jgi:hypothetical protein
MIYNTENQEILNLYHIYQEIKNCLTYYNALKEQFINYYNIKKSTTYYAFPNDNYGYNNEKKVNKEFYKGLNIERLNQIFTLYYEYNNKYLLGIDGDIYKRLQPLYEQDIKLMAEKTLKQNTMNLNICLNNFKQMLKTLIKTKLNNEVINDTSFYYHN